MIEAADNIIQLITTSVATVVALYRAARLKSRAWSMLGLFSGVYSLGLLYWLLFILFFELRSKIFSILLRYFVMLNVTVLI